MALLIRRGYVSAEKERDLVEVTARLHRKFDLFVVWLKVAIGGD
jgi:hypothetical protein